MVMKVEYKSREEIIKEKINKIYIELNSTLEISDDKIYFTEKKIEEKISKLEEIAKEIRKYVPKAYQWKYFNCENINVLTVIKKMYKMINKEIIRKVVKEENGREVYYFIVDDKFLNKTEAKETNVVIA